MTKVQQYTEKGKADLKVNLPDSFQASKAEKEGKGRKGFCAECAMMRRNAKDLTYLVHFLTKELDLARETADKAERELQYECQNFEQQIARLSGGEFKPAAIVEELEMQLRKEQEAHQKVRNVVKILEE